MKKIFFIFLMSILVSACGTVSDIQPTTKSDINKVNYNKEFSQYDKLVILDFKDSTTKSHNNDYVINKARVYFADQIASSAKKKSLFKEVYRNELPDGEALIIKGDITEYEKGNDSIKMLIGFWGQTKFNADVLITDKTSGKTLGTIKVDKNSWPLGGMIAVSQTPEVLMDESANSITDKLENLLDK